MNPATRDMLRALSERPDGAWSRSLARVEEFPWVEMAAWFGAGCPDVDPEDEAAPRSALHPTAVDALERLKALHLSTDSAEREARHHPVAVAVALWRGAGFPIPGHLDADASDLAALLVLLDVHSGSEDPKREALAERAAIWVERARRVLASVATTGTLAWQQPTRTAARKAATLQPLISVAATLVAEPAPLSVLDSFELLKRARRWYWQDASEEDCPACGTNRFQFHADECELLSDRHEIDAFLGSPNG